MSDDNPSLLNPPETSSGNLPEYSVSEISNVLKRTVEETFSYVRVRGELSRVTRHASGHCYFDLKDDRAVLAAVVWKGSFARLRVKPEQGLEVVCTGRLTTFPGASKYQIVVEEVELAGLGALMAMLEDRKKRLAAEGLFDPSRKKPIPFLPAVIGVVTSPSGAVIRDIMHRLNDRCPRRVLLWPVTVQGERAATEIAAAINGFNALPIDGAIPRPEVIIVARGGGSFEDLLAFSDEGVVRAAALSTIPLISAVGHDTDTTLIDFVSDRRAPTPTAAAEIAVPVMRDCLENILSLDQRNLRAISRFTARQKQHLQALARALPRPDSLFALPRQRFDTTSGRLGRALLQNLHRHSARFGKISAMLKPRAIAMEVQRSRQSVAVARTNLDRNFAYRLNRSVKEFEAAARILESVSYRAVLKRGFALVQGEHELRRNAAAVKPGEALTLIFFDGETKATASSKNGARYPRGKKPAKSQGDLF